MRWFELLGSLTGTVLGLLIAAFMVTAGYNMATNRGGKADQMAKDFEEMLERDERRGWGWLYMNREMNMNPKTYQSAGWIVLAGSVFWTLLVIAGLIEHVVAAFQSLH